MTATDVAAFRERLATGGVPCTPSEQVDLLRALEELKSTVAAVQATAALALDVAARAEDAGSGVPVKDCARDVPVRVGLALRESPARARSFLGAARVWRDEMPHTFDALRSGRLSPWRATVLVKETSHLPLEARAEVDARLCADPAALEGLGTARLTAQVKRIAAELDPAAAAERARRAESARAVWIRPAPDTMAYVTALLPVAQGVAVFAALRRAAASATATGDERSTGQLMADTLVERVTGQPAADAVPVTVDLVVSDATLLAGEHEPAVLVSDDGAAVVPAQVARHLVANALDADAAWVRRLYTGPDGDVAAVSSRRRFFADGLATLLRLRDQGLCRTPYCDAPVRHLDHVVPTGRAGPTDTDNGQGLCAACNLAKNTGRLDQAVIDGPGPDTDDGHDAAPARHTVTTTTRTGHTYTSTAPPAPAPLRPPRAVDGPPSPVDLTFAALVAVELAA